MSSNLFGVVIFGLFTLLWLAFGTTLIFFQENLDQAWTTLRGLPAWAQAIVWFLLLPVAAGLWIWETAWPLWLRLVLVIGLGWANVYAFFPRQS